MTQFFIEHKDAVEDKIRADWGLSSSMAVSCCQNTDMAMAFITVELRKWQFKPLFIQPLLTDKSEQYQT